ncbi:MAG: ABC transporter ATP-binding protein [Planctomycetes bacterium]|nr:ABC transporter ATP-binding protein [Planctomycetota bacterium]
MVRIELDHVTRRFGGDRAAIDDLSLEIQDGRLCVLLGPSGCGKSTTLRCIAGLEAIDAGTIRFAGRVMNDVDPRARDVAFVFQNYALYPHMTVEENIAFPLRMRGLRRGARQQRVREVAAELGLGDLLGRRPRHLSGGQQQRVALARALVREPKAFLFDEPLSNLDARLRVELRGTIQALHRRLGTTMLYVTHDQAEAMVLGERIAVLDRGRLQQYGTPAEIYARPANLFVAGFLGSPPMNLLRVVARGGRARCLGIEVAVPRREGELVLGLRPQDLVLGGEGLRVRAAVLAVEALGHETLARVQCGSETVVAWARGHAPGLAGHEAGFAFAAESLHAFDPVTGLRLDGDRV